MKYNFIDVEGFDGSGKSTIAKWISQEFGYEYHKSPSGLFAEVRTCFEQFDIRLKDRIAFYTGDCIRISMLFNEQIDRGNKFVLDRYFYSTIAYHESKQPNITCELREIYKALRKPDIILYITVDYETTLKRLKKRKNIQNDELFLSDQYYKTIDENFRQFFDVNYVTVDNNQDFEITKNQIRKILL